MLQSAPPPNKAGAPADPWWWWCDDDDEPDEDDDAVAAAAAACATVAAAVAAATELGGMVVPCGSSPKWAHTLVQNRCLRICAMVVRRMGLTVNIDAIKPCKQKQVGKKGVPGEYLNRSKRCRCVLCAQGPKPVWPKWEGHKQTPAGQRPLV